MYTSEILSAGSLYLFTIYVDEALSSAGPVQCMFDLGTLQQWSTLWQITKGMYLQGCLDGSLVVSGGVEESHTDKCTGLKQR